MGASSGMGSRGSGLWMRVGGRRSLDVPAEHLLVEIRRLCAHYDCVGSGAELLQRHGRQLVQGEAWPARTGDSGEDDLVERERWFRTQVAARPFVNVGVEMDGSRYSLGYAAQEQDDVGGVTLRRERCFADLAGILGPCDKPVVERVAGAWPRSGCGCTSAERRCNNHHAPAAKGDH